MPTYQYRCRNCGNELEVVQKMTDTPLTTCTKCEKETFERVISAEGGFVLKGSGFYGTDYCGKKSSSPTPAPAAGSCSTGSCPFAK
ncbi:MAG: zinc ribbon domain-containing protein [Chlorobiaceae bacterium]|jgi:putative FmdB family regulatory protein|nr:zinc ribbon domain-containing protein [Chlorobiaceae bacterium]NTW63758.1 zinc ribbon domain-containing protein [Chlorobiaceae bacterium]